MKSSIIELLDLLRKGSTNPNTEAESKPLPWTPLMCAVTINDLRAIRYIYCANLNVVKIIMKKG
jgi:hypothetical protein